MANSRVKAEKSKAKDARQSPAADRKPKRAPSKKKKPFVVKSRWVRGEDEKFIPSLHEWARRGRYRSTSEAEIAIENAERKYAGLECRIFSPRAKQERPEKGGLD